MVMPMLVSSDFLATRSELTMPRTATLGVSRVACFPDAKLPIILFRVQRPLEILRFQCVRWGLSWKMRDNDKLKNVL